MPSPNPGAQPPDDTQQPSEAHDPYGGLAQPSQDGGGWTRSPRTWIVAAVALVVLVVGGFLGANALSGGGSSSASTGAQGPGNGAGQGNPARRGTAGTLQSIDGSTLTVATFNRGANGTNAGTGTTTVLTNSSTTFAKAVTGSFSDIKVGDRVTSTGTPDGTNTLTANRITDTGTMTGAFGGQGGGGRRSGGNGNGGAPPSSVPNGGTRPDPNSVANGTVKSISGTTLTVTQQDGTAKTVNTNGGTVVSVLKAVSLNDLTTGQAVTVRGKTNSDGTVTATNVVEGLGGGRGFGGGGGQAPGTGSTTP
jgi:hypothetical protein